MSGQVVMPSTIDDLWRQLAEGTGPESVTLLRGSGPGHEAFVVVDDTAIGPAIGGLRMAPDVTVEEVCRLARAMTVKSAAAGLPHGGAKAGIVADPTMPTGQKEQVIRWFARAIRDIDGYTPGPDMGTNETCMAWIADEIGRSVGLPRVLGGIPLNEVGATGFGLAVCAETVAATGLLHLDSARVAIQGFGAVGSHAARFLATRGARVVAVADIGGAVANPVGLDVDDLRRWKASSASVRGFPGGEPLPRDDIVGVDSDVLVPAARGDAIHDGNVDRVKASVVLPGANLAVTADAAAVLHERGILVVPDFIANAGGVICASIELHGGTEAQAFATIEERIAANTAEVLRMSEREGLLPHVAAEQLAQRRLAAAHGIRRTFDHVT
jgi:glutamate dehydrogenase/leucine dehydrogenase